MVRLGVLAATLAGGIALTAAAAEAADSFTVLYNFPNVALSNPEADLLPFGAKLYGTTASDGASSYGTVFWYDPATAAHKTAYVFKGGAADGATPLGDLINVGGTLYGTTSLGGSIYLNHGAGTVFALNPKTGAEKIVYAFQAGNDGDSPRAGVTAVGGIVYGTTWQGGNGTCGYGCGTIFSVNPATGAETILHAFQGGSDGNNPEASLLKVGSVLYGTTLYGGDAAVRKGVGGGTIFSLDTSTGAYKTIYAFPAGSSGQSPTGKLIAIGGKLYGEAFGYKNATRGKLFSLDPATGTETILYNFPPGSDAVKPVGGLTIIGNTLYGVTSAGSIGAYGTLFSFNLDTSVEAVVHNFAGGSGGQSPGASPTAVNGVLYGPTPFGGVTPKDCSIGCGTLYSLTP